MRSATTARLHEVAAVLREDHAPRDRAHLVTRAADALQPLATDGRRLDLDDEVDGTHVDAELEAAGGDDRGQPPVLRPPRSARAAPCSPTRGGRAPARRRARASPACAISCAGATDPEPAGGQRLAPRARSWAISLSRAHSRSASRRELANTIVERWAATRSTTRSSTCGQIEARGSPRPRPATSPVGSPSALMSSTGTTTSSSMVFAAGGRTTSTARCRRGTGHLLDGAHRRGQPDPSCGSVEQRVEPLQRERQVSTALGAGDGVHLVDDDGLDAAQRLAGLRGQEEEERLRAS
jgi:hypothetical protein